YMVYASSTDLWQLRVGTGTAWAIVNGPAVVLNQWTHLVATFDGSTARLYVNGVLAGSGAVAAFSANASKPLRIGAGNTEGSPTFFLPGVLDEVAVYPAALSA